MNAKVESTEQTEQEMRAMETPWPKTEDELLAVIRQLRDREHDYGTACYAASLASSAVFNYIASHLGMTGFQASCATLDVMNRLRHIDGPFIILEGKDYLFPQYDVPGRLAEFRKDITGWLIDEAKKNLAEKSEQASPKVVQHWEHLATAARP